MRVAVLGLLVACHQANTPATPAPPATASAPTPTEAVSPCDTLAQLYCEALAIDCKQARDLLQASSSDPAHCRTVAADLASLRTGVGPDVFIAAATESWQEVLDAAPAEPKNPAPPTGTIACPESTAVRSQTRPRRKWCEANDGLPHGPVLTWNDDGEVVQDGTYERGRLVDPGFQIPASRRVPPEAFACPHGTALKEGKDPTERAKWCERPDGTWHGPAMIWRDGLVSRFADYQDGKETRSFSVTAEGPSPTRP